MVWVAANHSMHRDDAGGRDALGHGDEISRDTLQAVRHASRRRFIPAASRYAGEASTSAAVWTPFARSSKSRTPTPEPMSSNESPRVPTEKSVLVTAVDVAAADGYAAGR